MTDARLQQIIAGTLAAIALIGYLVLRAFDATAGSDPVLGAVITLLIGFIIGNVRTNGVGGTKPISNPQQGTGEQK